MDDVTSLGVGEPDFGSPEQIVRAGVVSLQRRIGRQHVADAVNAGDIQRLVNGELGEDGRQDAGQHGLPRTRRAGHDHVVDNNQVHFA